LDEQLLSVAAAQRDIDPVDLLLDLSLSDNLETRFRMPVANHDEAQVEPLLRSDCTVFGLSDAGAHASQLCDACQPTYFLGHWVRDKSAFTLEQAVRMLTSRPAEVAGISDRGRLEVGRPADIVIFDPTSVGDGPLQRVYDLPSGADRLVSEALGIGHVLVNGRILRSNGQNVIDERASLPGAVLRGGRAAAQA
jgi:N-acyl-D-aspartate/D-glutamate deacylase